MLVRLNPNDPVGELLRAAYRPAPTLPGLLEHLMRRLADGTRALGGSLSLHDHGTLTLSRRGGELLMDWMGASGAPRPALGEAAGRSIAAPLAYNGGAVIGELRLSLGGNIVPEPETAALCRAFGRACALLVNRYEVQRWTEERLKRPMMLIGMSAAACEAELFIEKVVASPLPVLIRGEFGTEKELIAASIHCLGPDRGGPFVVVHTPEHLHEDVPARLMKWFEQARGGTLFLDGLDELTIAAQLELLKLLRAGPSARWSAEGDRTQPRIIGSSTIDLRRLVKDGQFQKPLLMELDFLTITLRPLRSRREDIEPLVSWVLQRYGYRPDQKITDELIAACQAYAWPENLAELERIIARLAVMTGSDPIGRADILEYTPWVTSAQAPAAGEDGALRAATPAVAPWHQASPTEAARSWTHMILAKDFSQLGTLHDGVARALIYLSEHYHEPISLDQIARHARVSASHLSCLLKGSLGVSFKPLLGRLRVEQAKHLLATSRQTITDVAMAVGFADLSYFEKLFRRLVGVSPRAYRRQVRLPSEPGAPARAVRVEPCP